MKWQTTTKIEKVTGLIGQEIEDINFDTVDGNIKNLTIKTKFGAIRVGAHWENVTLSLPVSKFKITGNIKISNLTAVIDPESFDTLEAAQERLDEMLNAHGENFKGIITEVIE